MKSMHSEQQMKHVLLKKQQFIKINIAISVLLLFSSFLRC